METWRNIIFVALGHNRPPSVSAVAKQSRWTTAPLLSLTTACLPCLLILAGCALDPTQAGDRQQRQLTITEPAGLLPLARVRVSPVRALPAQVVYQLSPEYGLVVVRDSAEWSEVCRRCDLPAALREVNLKAGPVVGFLAEVGQNAEDRWPIRIVSIEMTDGSGLLTTAVLPGIYYPLRTAAYLELAQLRGPVSINTVRINSRTFTLGSAPQAH